MRFGRHEGLVAIARCQSHFTEGKLDHIAILAALRLLAQILEIYSLVQPLPWHGEPVKVVDVGAISRIDRFGGIRTFQFLAIHVYGPLLARQVHQHDPVLLIQAIAAGLLVPEMAAIGLRFTADTDLEIEAHETSGIPGFLATHGSLHVLSDFDGLGVTGVGSKQKGAGEETACNFSKSHLSIVAILPDTEHVICSRRLNCGRARSLRRRYLSPCL